MRNPTLDIAKGLGILAVVLGHNWISLHEPGELFNVLFSFHMPLFFVVSGALLKPSANMWVMSIQRGVSLLAPYATTMALVAAASAITGYLTLQYLIGVAYASGGTIPWQWAPLWFLPHLWVVGIAGVTVQRWGGVLLRGAWPQVLLLLTLLGGGYFWMNFIKQLPLTFYGMPVSEIGLPLGIDLIGITTFYYMVGYVFRKKIDGLKFSAWRMMLALCGFLLIHWLTNDTIDLNRRRYDDLFICTASALCAIYLVFSISEIASRYRVATRYLAYLGRGSLFILIFHFAMQNVAYNILFYHGKTGHGWASFGSFFVGVAGPLVMLELVRRHRVLRTLWMPRAFERRLEKRTAANGGGLP